MVTPDEPAEQEPVRLTPDEEQELTEAMEEIERGEFVDGEELLEEIRTRRDWPDGFFDEVIGGWKGELERSPQPPLETR